MTSEDCSASTEQGKREFIAHVLSQELMGELLLGGTAAP
jgi:hypothetical protein